MGHKFEFGTFELETSGDLCRLTSIPEQMKCEHGNILCAILNVCSGRMNIYKDGKKLKLDINYFKLYVDSENSCPKKSSWYMDDFALIYPDLDEEYINKIDRKLIIESNKNIHI